MYYSFQQAIKWEKMTGECHLHHEISNNEEKNVFPFFFFSPFGFSVSICLLTLSLFFTNINVIYYQFIHLHFLLGDQITDTYHALVQNIWQWSTITYLRKHHFKSLQVQCDLMHGPVKEKATIIILFIAWCVIGKYGSVLVNYIEKMSSVTIHHPF